MPFAGSPVSFTTKFELLTENNADVFFSNNSLVDLDRNALVKSKLSKARSRNTVLYLYFFNAEDGKYKIKPTIKDNIAVINHVIAGK